MKPANLLTVDWAKLYGYLSEAVDHAGFLVVTRTDGVMNLVHKDSPAKVAPVSDAEDLIDQAKDLVKAGCSVDGAFDWLLEQLIEAPDAEEPTYFSIDMDGTMVPDPDGQWVRR
ncbi:hypothetical protein PQD76_gp21 [Stenotrophomonas phage BUCT626]|uniref:Uncharacterized protein n=1 Tax=Stenotrophomonas phage BUCT626 TaxID=2860376 RepID=A0AC61NGK9_9CAUD|nr:hypothetical protein PQD76_gp21 [Stenotrophomonas phage BUCT626]QYC96725.1 hypothetical protein [Stenotrophomonas phage BUCT626]